MVKMMNSRFRLRDAARELTTAKTKSPQKIQLSLVLSFATYALLAVLGNSQAWLRGASTHVVHGVGGDSGQHIWFLASVANALQHLSNPLLSSMVNAPAGVDLANMTSMPLLGLIGAPITWLFGVAVTYNVLLIACYFTAAASMYVVSGRWVNWPPGRFVAGLIFGFSPYMTSQGSGHLFLSATCLLPLLLLALDEIFVRQQWTPRRAGVTMGLLVAGQVMICVEFFANSVALGCLGLLLLGLCNRERVVARWPYIVRAVTWAVAVAVLPLGYFLWCYHFYAGHAASLTRPAWTVANLSADLTTFFIPGVNQLVHHGTWVDAFVNFWYGTNLSNGTQYPDPFENGAYVSIFVMAVVVATVVALRHRKDVRLFAALGGSALLLSMGRTLRVAGHSTGLPLPFWVVEKLPAFNNTLAIRWMAFVWLFLALMVGLGVQTLYRGCRGKSLVYRSGAAVGATLTAALVVVSLSPPWPINSEKLQVPAWFTTPAAATMPEGSTLLTYPLANSENPVPMLWQAVNGFHFKLVGALAGSQTIDLGSLGAALGQCSTQPTLTAPVGVDPLSVRSELKLLGIDTIVVAPVYAKNSTCAVAFFTNVLGNAPQSESDVLTWRHPSPSQH